MRKSLLISFIFFAISCQSPDQELEAMKAYDYKAELGAYQEFGVGDFIDNRAPDGDHYYLTGLNTVCCTENGCFSTKMKEDSGAYNGRDDYFSKFLKLDAVYGKFAPQMAMNSDAKASCPAEVAAVVKANDGGVSDIFKYAYEFSWKGTFLSNESLKEFPVSGGSKASWMKRFNDKDQIRYFKHRKEPNKLFAVLVSLQTANGHSASYLAFYTKLEKLGKPKPVEDK